jgi:hypothetical protein
MENIVRSEGCACRSDPESGILEADHWLHISHGMTWRLLLTLVIYSATCAALSIGAGDLAVALTQSMPSATVVKAGTFVLVAGLSVLLADPILTRLKKVVHW